MKALVYKGPRTVSVVNVPDATIEQNTAGEPGWTKVVLKPAG